MAFPSATVDLDSLTREVDRRIRNAIRWWQRGILLSEEPLLNHILGRLDYRKQCDVGLGPPVLVSTNAVLLHRRGRQTQDLFGCDLAVTIAIPSARYLKTAFIQLKRVSGLSVECQREQAVAASQFPYVRNRAFVAAVDTKGRWVRIGDFPNTTAFVGDTKSFACGAWPGLTEWFRQWVQCHRGATSTPFGRADPESVLYFFRASQGDKPSWGIEQYPELRQVAAESDAPARAWLQLTLGAELTEPAT